MDLRLIGPFELAHDGVSQPLPGRGERALLAVLALAAPDTVAATTLIELLWSEEELPRRPVQRPADPGLQAPQSPGRHGGRAAGGPARQRIPPPDRPLLGRCAPVRRVDPRRPELRRPGAGHRCLRRGTRAVAR